MSKEIQIPSAIAEPADETAASFWKNRLHHRRYHFPAFGGSEEDFAARIDHAGKGGFFPLGTPDADTAATRARNVYQSVVKQGWHAACRQFSRELVVSFEWCMNPVFWTYTTIHTLVGGQATTESGPSTADNNRQRVLVVETEEGIRRALCWSINQQARFSAIPCDSVASFTRALALNKPRLVLLNRNLAEPLGFPSPGAIGPIQPGMPALTYSVHADGDQMFASTPEGAEGYLVKRVKPNRLLEPILNAACRPGLMTEDLLPSVKSYFQSSLLQSNSGRDDLALAKLPRREREVLELLSKGWVDKEIAQTLGISVWTAHEYVKNIFERLKVRTRTEAVVRYLGR